MKKPPSTTLLDQQTNQKSKITEALLLNTEFKWLNPCPPSEPPPAPVRWEVIGGRMLSWEVGEVITYMRIPVDPDDDHASVFGFKEGTITDDLASFI